MYPQCANPVFLDTRQQKRRKNIRDHDMLLGGNVDVSFSPALVSRMKVIALRPDQCPFQFFIPVNAYWSLRSGIQSPVVNSRSSTCTRSLRASSRLLGGRPLRRSAWSSLISSVSRSMYLVLLVVVSRGLMHRYILGDKLGHLFGRESVGVFLHGLVDVFDTVH